MQGILLLIMVLLLCGITTIWATANDQVEFQEGSKAE